LMGWKARCRVAGRRAEALNDLAMPLGAQAGQPEVRRKSWWRQRGAYLLSILTGLGKELMGVER
jgi:hypothetical protein